MGSLRAGFVLSAALIMAVAGCSSQEPGSAIGTTTQTSASTPTTTSKSSSPKTTSKPAGNWPARPKAIDITGANPCDILKRLPPEFEVMARGEPSLKDSLVFKGAKECLTSNPAKSSGLSLTAAAFSAEEFAAGGRGTVTPTTVAGFPAFTIVVNETLGACFLGLDVAEKQMLYLQWSDSTPGTKRPSAELCTNVTRVGVAVLKALGA